MSSAVSTPSSLGSFLTSILAVSDNPTQLDVSVDHVALIVDKG
jgi:hypothetical protein